jgi:2-oxoglutarate-Fe(II)-dependent oxygenase superfamily protein
MLTKFAGTHWQARNELFDRDILVIRNGMPFLRDLVALAKAHQGVFKPSGVVKAGDETGYVDKNQRSSDHVTLTAPGLPAAFMDYESLCRDVEGSFIGDYIKNVNSHASVVKGSDHELLRYNEGQYFKEHVDVIREHPILGHRRLALVAFCNDDVVGGELHFTRHNITVKPEAGTVIVFPAGLIHPHESRPVLSGVKYSLVSWFH